MSKHCINCGITLVDDEENHCENCARSTESGERDELRAATDLEITAARNIHASTDLNIDEGAKVVECSEGVWVQAWVWISTADVRVHGNE